MIFTYEEALRATAPDAWRALSKQDKVEALQAVEDHVATEQGRIACDLSAKPLYQGKRDAELGYYDPSTGEIVVNERELELGARFGQDPDQMVEATLHEGRHAYQDQAVKGIIRVDDDEIADWAANMREYIPFEKNPKGYWNQPIEADAREYAGTRLGRLADERADCLRAGEAAGEGANRAASPASSRTHGITR